jgi:hypothetical protein
LINQQTLYGLLVGLLAAFLGSFVIVALFSEGSFGETITELYALQKLGGLISIGALVNLPMFFYFLRKNNLPFATGLVFASLLLVLLVAYIKINP